MDTAQIRSTKSDLIAWQQKPGRAFLSNCCPVGAAVANVVPFRCCRLWRPSFLTIEGTLLPNSTMEEKGSVCCLLPYMPLPGPFCMLCTGNLGFATESTLSGDWKVVHVCKHISPLLPVHSYFFVCVLGMHLHHVWWTLLTFTPINVTNRPCNPSLGPSFSWWCCHIKCFCMELLEVRLESS